MQFLIFHLGKDRYGLSTRNVIRLLPLMELKQIPHTPDYVTGLMNLHGEAVPVIDLCMLACGVRCEAHFDTRIVLIDYRTRDGVARKLGLIAERVAGLQDIDREAFSDPGVTGTDAPYLGQVTAADHVLLQLIEVEHLLPETVRALLFPTEQVEP